MLFPIRGRCWFIGKAAEPTRQMHFRVLAIRRACGIAPEPPRQMHFQVLAICRACGIVPELRAPQMPCVVIRVDDQELYDRSISDMMCV